MDLAKFIDHSILRPYHTLRDLEEEIKKCIELGVYGVCVNPFWVKPAKELAGKSLKVCSTISFPFGLIPKEQKVYQSLKAMEDGTDELDIVMNVSALKSGLTGYVREELLTIGRQTEGVIRKVIIETAYLNQEEKRLALEATLDAGMEFVKTSTGYAPQGATEEDVKLLVEASKGRIRVKASGGIKRRNEAERFILLGASRIGTSSTFSILTQGE
ncbi:MAG: deoxyribose-phosphate aldolase [Aquificaceae bacterium]